MYVLLTNIRNVLENTSGGIKPMDIFQACTAKQHYSCENVIRLITLCFGA